MADEKTTLIDGQADFEGKLTGKDAFILGRFRGEIQLSGRLVMGEGSKVDAKVRADAVEVAGEFKGDIAARAITLAEKAKVEGSLEARALAVREGARLNGSVNADGASKPKAAVSASPTPPTPPSPTPPAAAASGPVSG
jgi:cytoskeletal protein CcmA (bactofilin family)